VPGSVLATLPCCCTLLLYPATVPCYCTLLLYPATLHVLLRCPVTLPCRSTPPLRSNLLFYPATLPCYLDSATPATSPRQNIIAALLCCMLYAANLPYNTTRQHQYSPVTQPRHICQLILPHMSHTFRPTLATPVSLRLCHAC
jgi:hypothetical protein